jgi:predicted O-linked N-acetylglucosamine transferase (SPINDLY family)/2-polyprenyl-3-methyl-5-hydroxy-6-metoxy-1,4-benzoquinol methylase
MNSQHILLYTDDPGSGGVAHYNHNILLSLVAQGYRVSVAQSRQENPLIVQQRQSGVQHRWLKFDTLKEFGRTLSHTPDAEEILSATSPDLIIFSDCCPFSNFAAKQVAIAHRIPYITVIGFVAPYLAERFAQYLPELAQQYTQAKAVIAVSQDNLDLLHQLFRLPHNQGQVIYYGRPEQYFAPRSLEVRDRLRQEVNIPQEAVVCLTTARLEAVKGFKYQLAAIAQLCQTSVWNNLYFVWAGSGSQKDEIATVLEQSDFGNHVKLIGHRWDVADWYDAADIFVLPSELEGMPLAIMEAMAKGLPIIASAVSGIPEELDNTGQLLTDPKLNSQATVDQLASTIKHWVEQPAVRLASAEASQQRARQTFQESQMLQQTLTLIESVLEANSHSTVKTPGSTMTQPASTTSYNDEFYEAIQAGSRASAQVILPFLLKLLYPVVPQSVVDVGCGVGTWLAAFHELGVQEYLGFDGEYVDQSKLQIPHQKFRAWDLKQPLPTEQKFDIAMSLEVAEHLPDTCAANFVQSLVKLAPVVLFSAAIPAQGGVDHINEQWPSYWVELFQRQGYVVIDCLRQAIWDHPDVEPWYAQNILLFVQGDRLHQYSRLAPAYQPHIPDLARVHPKIFVSAQYAAKKESQGTSGHNATSILSSGDAGLPGEYRPLVSVIIPCYNQAHLLPEAVASVVVQSYANWEIIIVNDGSPDDTSEVAFYLANLYSQAEIQLVEKENGGLPSARNAGIAAANGEYLLPLDADDRLSSGAIAALLKMALGHRGSCLAFGSYHMFGEEEKIVFSLNLYSPDNLKQFNMFHPASLYPKAVWYLVGGYDEEMVDGYEDWDFLVKCHEHQVTFLGTPEIVLHYRRTTGSMVAGSVLKHDKIVSGMMANHPQFYGVEASQRGAELRRNLELFREAGVQSILKLNQVLLSYKNTHADDQSLQALQEMRYQISQLWLSMNVEDLEYSYQKVLLNYHQRLYQSGIQQEPLTERETLMVNQSLDRIGREFDYQRNISDLLVLRLYKPAYQLNLHLDLEQIPKWLIEDYLQFILSTPQQFENSGEVEQYYQFFKKWVEILHTSILENLDSPFWKAVTEYFAEKANFIPLYFNDFNLKDIYYQRAEILEQYCLIKGYTVDYDFPLHATPRKKIRLGVLVNSLLDSAETFASLPIFEYIGRQFEVYLYTVQATGLSIEHYCHRNVNASRILPDQLPDQVEVIRRDDLDILFIGTNVTAVTNQVCLLATHRLARIQVTSGASVVTTGMRNIDYFISGTLTDAAEDSQQHYREKLVKLPGIAQCFSYGEGVIGSPIQVTRTGLGISEDAVVFVSVANFYKLIPEVLESWAEIIAAVPRAVLLLFPYGLNWSSDYPKSSFVKQVQRVFNQKNLPGDHVIIADPQPTPNREELKAYLKLADVYLDSYPFAGTTSLIEPLEVSLPIVTQKGLHFRSAMGAALMQAAGLVDNVTTSAVDYRQRAIALGCQPELRQQQQDQTKNAMQSKPPFLDSAAYAKNIESLFLDLYQTQQSQALKQTFRLRDKNLLAFPDWQKPEEQLFEELASLLREVMTHPDRQDMTLLVHVGDFAEEEADIAISSVVMYLIAEEGLTEDELEIVLVNHLEDAQWQALSSNIEARLVLDHEGMTPAVVEHVKALALADL